MRLCSECSKEISEEQQGKYFKRCPACYQKYKVRSAKVFLVPSFLWFGIAAMYLAFYFQEAAAGRVDVVRLLLAICCILVGQVSLHSAWRWRFTEVVARKYDKSGPLWGLVLFAPALFIAVLTLIVLAVSPSLLNSM